MTIDPGTLDRLLADAVGPDSAVAADLRALFLASATQHLAAMSQPASPAAWRDEALRLQGLAASFGVVELAGQAAEAAAAAAPDATLLDRLARSLADCRR
ncbi:MAG: hypothetical protein ACOY5R_13095 [Pseudomonadota bacterium]|uniref:hypothetical protein n=1 Tax=Rhizorhabdus phycosphaerae TaxID=2711156 RepID=UPI0013EDCB64|nr:hypothetical protein [Rhizorhabdus phycosphaerae]